jgi:cytochrome c biogenesis protein CcdA
MSEFYLHKFRRNTEKLKREIKISRFFLILFFYANIFAFNFDFNLENDNYFSNTLEFSTAFLSQNDTIIAAVLVNIPENYHLYSNPKGPGVGRDLNISLIDSANAEILFAKKQIPHKFLPEGEPQDQWVWAWKDSAVIFFGFSPESQFPVNIKIEGVYCDVSCIPFSQIVEIFPDKSYFDEYLTQIFATAEVFPIKIMENFIPAVPPQNYTLFTAIFFAFLAGIILNFMPCVLPVLGIKILSFTENTIKKTAILRSLAFSAGIIFVFLILALITIQAKIWWGQQFQNPIFITVLSIFMLVGALFLFDILVISPNSKIAEIDRKQDKSTLLGNFVRGICATILATPCSGPFLGAIMAWTMINDSKTATFTVFLSVAVGMSAPYILLSIFGGANISGKIGKYSQIIKKILGVILLIFAVYLFYSANSEKFFKTKILENTNSIWQPFSIELFEDAQKNRQSVIVDFTAKWCLNCQYNKITVYETKEIREILQRKNILALTADLTNENPQAQKIMEKLGAKSIPFLAIFDGNNFTNPIVFYDIVSKKTVSQTLEKIK